MVMYFHYSSNEHQQQSRDSIQRVDSKTKVTLKKKEWSNAVFLQNVQSNQSTFVTMAEPLETS